MKEEAIKITTLESYTHKRAEFAKIISNRIFKELEKEGLIVEFFEFLDFVYPTHVKLEIEKWRMEKADDN